MAMGIGGTEAVKEAFDKAGSVTAGNASGINDGAAAVVVMSARKVAFWACESHWHVLLLTPPADWIRPSWA